MIGLWEEASALYVLSIVFEMDLYALMRSEESGEFKTSFCVFGKQRLIKFRDGVTLNTCLRVQLSEIHRLTRRD